MAGRGRAGGSERGAEEAEAIVDVDYALQSVPELRVLQQGHATQFEYGRAELVSYEHGVSAETEHGTVTADWKGREFRIEHALDDGTKVVEIYRLDPRLDRLHWDLTLERKKAKTVEIARVYARGAAGGLNLAATGP